MLKTSRIDLSLSLVSFGTSCFHYNTSTLQMRRGEGAPGPSPGPGPGPDVSWWGGDDDEGGNVPSTINDGLEGMEGMDRDRVGCKNEQKQSDSACASLAPPSCSNKVQRGREREIEKRRKCVKKRTGCGCGCDRVCWWRRWMMGEKRQSEMKRNGKWGRCAVEELRGV